MKRKSRKKDLLLVAASVAVYFFLSYAPAVPVHETLPPDSTPPWCPSGVPCALVGVRVTYTGYGSVTYVLFGFGYVYWPAPPI